MKFRKNNIYFEVSPLFFITTSLLLVLDKSGYMGYSVLFSLVHETGHILMMLLIKKPPREIKLKFYGVEIQTSVFNNKDEVIISLAGPFINIFLALIFTLIYLAVRIEKFIILSGLNMVIASFNMLPINGLDGGDILIAILSRFYKNDKVDKYASYINLFIAIFVLILGIVMMFYNNIGIFIVGMYLLVINLLKSN